VMVLTVQVDGRRPKIRVRHLEVFYRRERILGSVSVDIYPGITVILGPSGSGKTTFLRALNRMHDAVVGMFVYGKVFLDNRDIYAPGTNVPEIRRRVGLVFQKPNPFPLSIYDNVAYGPRRHGTPRRHLDEIVRWSLEQAGLWEEVKNRLRAPAHRLSGGQQQRLCIARALAVRPEVLLMDEPTSALDPLAAARVEGLIARLARDLTVVVVTHDIEQARRLDGRALLFQGGRLLASGPTRRLLSSHRDHHATSRHDPARAT